MAKEKIPVYYISNLTSQPLEPGDFMIERFSHYLNRQSPHLHHPHRHVFYHLVCFTSGSGSHFIDFTRFPVKPAQMYFMTPGQVHSWNFKEQPDGYVINFSDEFFRSFLLNPNYLDGFSFFSGAGEESVCQLVSPVKEKVYALLENTLEQYEQRTDNSADMIRVLLLQVFLLVEAGVDATKKHSPLPRQKQLLLNNLKQLIEQHYKTIRLPKAYAALLHVTPNHLNALCQDLLGKSAGELIRARVLLEAKRLLTNAGMTVAEIAYELNFQDNSYFNRFFKKYEGITPDEFRKKHIRQ